MPCSLLPQLFLLLVLLTAVTVVVYCFAVILGLISSIVANIVEVNVDIRSLEVRYLSLLTVYVSGHLGCILLIRMQSTVA